MLETKILLEIIYDDETKDKVLVQTGTGNGKDFYFVKNCQARFCNKTLHCDCRCAVETSTYDFDVIIRFYERQLANVRVQAEQWIDIKSYKEFIPIYEKAIEDLKVIKSRL